MLEIQNLKKSFKGKGGKTKVVLNDISFSLPDKGMYFIVGKSGSGKSTLLNLIGGLDTPDSGEIILDGRCINKLDSNELLSYRSSTIGFVFQEYNLINDISVESNIRLAADRTIDDGEIQSLLDKYDLSEFKNKRVNLLSGGEKQRVSLIRALIKNPRLILCDEPTGALDSENSKKVFEYLKEASKDRLVLVVSHDRESADKYGDGLIEIIDGEIKKYSLNTSIEVNTELQNINVTKRIKLSFNKRKDLIASLFRNRKLRFIAIIFVFLCSFSLLGITNSITSYNEDEATLKSMYSKGSNSLAFKKNLYNSNNSYNKLFEFNDDDISSVKSKVDTIIPVSSFLSSKAINNGKGTFQINSKDDQDSYLECYVGGSVEIDDDFLDKTKLTLSYGSLPSNDDEIVISDFFADMYRRFGLIEEDKSITKIDSLDQLLGEKVRFNKMNSIYSSLPQSYKIVGILDTYYDSDFFDDAFKNSSDDEYWNKRSLLQEEAKYSLYNLAYFNYGFLSKYKINEIFNDYFMPFESGTSLYINCNSSLETITTRVVVITPVSKLDSSLYTLKDDLDDKENIVVLEKDFFESLSKNTYFESDFNSFDLYSESLDFKSKFNIGGYTTDDYGKGKGYIYVSDSLYSKIIEKAKPYITPYSEIIYPFTGNLGKDLSALNDIKTNVTDVSIKFDRFDFTKWKGSSVTSNRFYYESRKKSAWLMDIIKIVEYVSWGFVAICSLFLLLSIIDLIQKSIKKIGVLWSLGYSILDISSLFLIVESILLGIAFLFSLVICYLGIWLANSLLLTNALYINNLFNFGIVQIGYILLVLVVCVLVGFGLSILRIKHTKVVDVISDRK